MKNLGNLAKDREKQVIEWALENPYTSFSSKGIVKALFHDDTEEDIRFSKGFPDVLLQSYHVACEDLRRRQILKGVGNGSYILNDIDTVKGILEI